MYRKKECVAMLLAGGQGSRLYVLTTKVAKPAVPFGGKYRIIDFPLSNCVNSGIDTVGVLTQYEPHALNAYIGSGQTWDLDRMRGGVYTLPPYQRGKGADWYKGTANAIYQNIAFIEEYDPDYVLILSGDHIYKMNYNKMLQHHKKMGADATIAVMDVPMDEASRFGIMNCHEDGTIYEFEEKPKHPKSTLASMGIYIFIRRLPEGVSLPPGGACSRRAAPKPRTKPSAQHKVFRPGSPPRKRPSRPEPPGGEAGRRQRFFTPGGAPARYALALFPRSLTGEQGSRADVADLPSASTPHHRGAGLGGMSL